MCNNSKSTTCDFLTLALRDDSTLCIIYSDQKGIKEEKHEYVAAIGHWGKITHTKKGHLQRGGGGGGISR